MDVRGGCCSNRGSERYWQGPLSTFRRGSAKVVVADVDEKGTCPANEIGGLAVKCDVRKEGEIIELVREDGKKIGPIDAVFCSNAGTRYRLCGCVQ